MDETISKPAEKNKLQPNNKISTSKLQTLIIRFQILNKYRAHVNLELKDTKYV